MNAVNMTRKDLINARNSSKTVKDALGNIYTVSGAAIDEKGGTDKQGNPCDVGYIATNEGIFGFTSNVMLKGMNDLMDYLSDALDETTGDGVEEVKIRFFSGTSKNGSEFYNFELM